MKAKLRHKINICRFCKKPFYGHIKRTYCFREECEKKRYEEKKQYAIDYNAAYKKRNRSPVNFHSVKEEIKIEEIYTKIPCLKCHHIFKSEGIHNRLCDSCRNSNNNLAECERRYEVWL